MSDTNKIYQEWINHEKREAKEAYERYKEVISHQSSDFSNLATRNSKFKLRLSPFASRIAAAILILTLGTTLWLKRSDLFGPRYTDEQIAWSYEHTLKTLALYSKNLTEGFDKLQAVARRSLAEDPARDNSQAQPGSTR